VQPMITWYDILDVMPGASTEEIQSKYESRASLLRPEHISGAPSAVITAASRAQQLLDSARRVLGDPATRTRYDTAVGIRRSGGGLAQEENFPSEPGLGPEDFDLLVGARGAEALAGLIALADWLAPHPGPPRRVIVPDVRGLFYVTCLQIVGKLGFRIRRIQLTEHPMPVEGLVVGQSPRPATKARRASELTVQVWHPPH
jgi:curved DNA-binding protein CbpA